jgi:Glycosyltransferase family 87
VIAAHKADLDLRRWQMPIVVGLTALSVAIFVFNLWELGTGSASDAHAYFAATLQNPYANSTIGTTDAYDYSPAFSQLIEPLRWLGWDAFRELWRVGAVTSLVVLAGPFSGLLAFTTPVAIEVNLANVHLLVALAIVAGFRWPATWAFVLLTKVTPGIGLLWFAVRREWRSLAIALGVTAAISLVSFVLAPTAWVAWVGVLAQGGGPQPGQAELLPVPVGLRLIAAAVITVIAARTNQRWGVIVAAFVAMPITWTASASVLVGILALNGHWAAALHRLSITFARRRRSVPRDPFVTAA